MRGFTTTPAVGPARRCAVIARTHLFSESPGAVSRAGRELRGHSAHCPEPRVPHEPCAPPCSCTGCDVPSLVPYVPCSWSPAPVAQVSGKRGAVPAKESLRASVSSCTGRPMGSGSGSGSAAPGPSCEVWLTYTTMMSPLKFITCPLEMNVELLFPVTFPARDRV